MGDKLKKFCRRLISREDLLCQGVCPSGCPERTYSHMDSDRGQSYCARYKAYLEAAGVYHYDLMNGNEIEYIYAKDRRCDYASIFTYREELKERDALLGLPRWNYGR